MKTARALLSLGCMILIASTALARPIDVPLEPADRGPAGATGTARINCTPSGQVGVTVRVEGLEPGQYELAYWNEGQEPVLIGTLMVNDQGRGSTHVQSETCPIGEFQELRVTEDSEVLLKGQIGVD